MPPVLRFAPSPNGELHLGHALSAMMNFDMARDLGGDFLLRIEDIDPDRCRPEYEAGIYDDLTWLGLKWQEPVRRQSDHIPAYRAALERLKAMGLVYPAFLSRSRVKTLVTEHERGGGAWPRDPDGTPLYPTHDRSLDANLAASRIAAGEKLAWRLDMHRALAFLTGHEGGARLERTWLETGSGSDRTVAGDPSVWGDAILWRRDTPSSYHLSVVVDDALQGITHVVRGTDLLASTPLHVLLQALLDLPTPIYHHHRLILGDGGDKLSKSLGSTGIRALRAQGWAPSDIRRRVGL